VDAIAGAARANGFAAGQFLGGHRVLLAAIPIEQIHPNVNQPRRFIDPQALEELTIIAGQRAQVRRARKSIAQFKIREGMPIGVKVTLRGDRMWEFLDRLISIALPRIRDFRGLNPDSFDGRGNYSLGIREQIIFPEIDYDSINQIRGLDVAITTTAKNDDQARALLTALGMPFAAADGGNR